MLDFHTFDEEYLRRLSAHDAATEKHFILYFSEKLNIRLRSIGLIQAEIDQVRQETFLRVWDAIRQKSLRHPQAFGSYVHAICERVLQESGSADVQRSDPQETAVSSPGLGLEEEIQKFENGYLVRALLEALPKRDREILSARFFEDRDNDDICQQFGVSGDYLRVLMHRAIKKFGELYRKEDQLSKSATHTPQQPS